MTLTDTKQVPVMVHVPKNAGTYMITTALRRMVRHYHKNKMGWVRLLKVSSEQSVFTVVVNFLDDEHLEDPHVMQHVDCVRKGVVDHRVGRCSLKTLDRYMGQGKAQVLWCVADSEVLDGETGHMDMRVTLFECLRVVHRAGKQPVNFTLLRNPFDRQQSLYNYLTSDQSRHEPSHGMFDHATFEQFAASDQVEDSWFIRTMCGMHHSTPMNGNWYNTCCDFLDRHRFVIRDVSRASELLQWLLVTCVRCDEQLDTEPELDNRASYSRRVQFEQLPLATQQHFHARVRWDQALWDRYCAAG